MKNILVTGAAGFIGSAFVREALQHGCQVHVLDAFTYAGHRENLEDPSGRLLPQTKISNLNICSWDQLKGLAHEDVDALVNFAAESHVDNSISGPRVFIETNLIGTFNLLELSRTLAKNKKDFRFLHVSTDEVFGELGPTGKFSETTPYAPNSPYSASKAGSDHLVRAWHHTYNLNTVTTNCSNNYGPRQFPEKLIPRMISNALKGLPLPVYGNGMNVRDWIHVEDHARGIWLALKDGKAGETYCFGGNSERNNVQVVEAICSIMDQLKPRSDGKKHKTGIQFVQDRAGHDLRYAIDDTKAEKELGYRKEYQSFEKGLEATVKWYLENEKWIQTVTANAQQRRTP